MTIMLVGYSASLSYSTVDLDSLVFGLSIIRGLGLERTRGGMRLFQILPFCRKGSQSKQGRKRDRRVSICGHDSCHSMTSNLTYRVRQAFWSCRAKRGARCAPSRAMACYDGTVPGSCQVRKDIVRHPSFAKAQTVTAE
jgi:hypothetical protein